MKEKDCEVNDSEFLEVNSYNEEKPKRLKRIDTWGDKLIKLNKEMLEAEANYDKFKKAFYDATNVAVIEGDISESGKTIAKCPL